MTETHAVMSAGHFKEAASIAGHKREASNASPRTAMSGTVANRETVSSNPLLSVRPCSTRSIIFDEQPNSTDVETNAGRNPSTPHNTIGLDDQRNGTV